LPLARGRKEVWACGIVRTIGWANVLDDPKQSPYVKLIDIDPKFGVAESTGQGKSMAIRRMFGIGRLNPDWTLPSRYGDNPLVWNVEVNGMLVDIRQESREQQEAAFQEGLIPYIPADRTTVMDDKTSKPPEIPRLDSLEGGLFGAISGFHKRTMTLLRESDLDDEEVGVVGNRIEQLLEEVTANVKRTKDFNLEGPLESAYDEVERLVAELSQSSGHDGGEPA
jgi:hypothetical protein